MRSSVGSWLWLYSPCCVCSLFWDATLLDIKVRQPNAEYYSNFVFVQYIIQPTFIYISITGTYFTHEAKGADDAADADTAIINAEGGQTNTDDKKEYYI